MATEASQKHDSPHARYSIVAIALHWAIAAGIIFQLLLGWRMQEFEGFARSSFLQVHKSVGILILALSVARLAWRLGNPPPAAEESLTPLERRLSHWVHLGFYAVMIGAPLTGWGLVSMTRAGGSFELFGVVPWFRIPFLASIGGAANEFLGSLLDNGHLALVWLAVGLLALHVLGALKHQFLSRDRTLARMAPGAQPGFRLQPWLIGIPVAALVVAGGAYALQPGRAPPKRPKPQQLAAADLYLDIVGPALVRRCEACHSADLARGGLSVSNYGDLMAGGSHGPVISVGAPGMSEIYRRITLPTTHKLYMPRDGKTPLSAEQTAALRYWISVGAPNSVRLSTLNVPADLKPALEKTLGLAKAQSGAEDGQVLDAAPPGLSAPDPAAVAALESSGFIVRPITQKNVLVDVDYYAVRTLGPADFKNLAKIGKQIRGLKLARAGVTDSSLAALGDFENLAVLSLDENPVTDAGIASLTNLPKLRVINLHGTKVGDAGVKRLAGLRSVRRIYAWDTAVSPATIESIRKQNPNVSVFGAGLDIASVPVPNSAASTPPK